MATISTRVLYNVHRHTKYTGKKVNGVNTWCEYPVPPPVLQYNSRYLRPFPLRLI